MTDSRHNSISPYRRGADDGFAFGVLLCVMFFAGVFSFSVPLLGLVSAAILFSVPIVIYRLLRRTYVAEGYTTLLSTLWMQGIVTFACGCLISGLVAAVYLKWINPDFMVQRIHEAIDFYRESSWPSGEKMADTLELMLANNIMPSAAAMVVEMIWLGIFSGSLLSLLMGLLARARGKGSAPKQQ